MTTITATTATWQLQTAKNKLSELVDQALTGQIQLITRRGQNVVAVVDYEKFKSLEGAPKTAFEMFSKYRGLDMPEVLRDKSLVRNVSPFAD